MVHPSFSLEKNSNYLLISVSNRVSGNYSSTFLLLPLSFNYGWLILFCLFSDMCFILGGRLYCNIFIVISVASIQKYTISNVLSITIYAFQHSNKYYFVKLSTLKKNLTSNYLSIFKLIKKNIYFLMKPIHEKI